MAAKGKTRSCQTNVVGLCQKRGHESGENFGKIWDSETGCKSPVMEVTGKRLLAVLGEIVWETYIQKWFQK